MKEIKKKYWKVTDDKVENAKTERKRKQTMKTGRKWEKIIERIRWQKI